MSALLDDAYSELLEMSNELRCGLIPLLEDLQSKHPEFAEESVFRALENCRERRDSMDEITDRIEKEATQ